MSQKGKKESDGKPSGDFGRKKPPVIQKGKKPISPGARSNPKKE